MTVSSKEIREYFAKFGKQGGKTRAKNMTKRQRADSARKAAQARWKNAKQGAAKRGKAS